MKNSASITGRILIIIGALAVIAAGALLAYQKIGEADSAGKQQEILAALDEIIPEESAATSALWDGTDASALATQVIDGVDCAGRVEFTGAAALMPVAGASYSGSALPRICQTTNGPAIIGDKSSGFEILGSLQPGDQVVFADLGGNRYTYAVSGGGPGTLEEITADLLLAYPSGGKYYIIACDRSFDGY